MKKITLLFATLFIVSCGLQKKSVKDPYVGVYEITVFDVDQIGDVPLTLTINKTEAAYTSNIEMRGEAAESGDFTWEITETKIENEVITIEAYVSSYDVYFELYINEDEVSGSLMGMFDVEGARVEKK